MGRVGELVLGIIAGILGIFASLIALAFGGLAAAIKFPFASYVVLGSFVAIIASILGMTGAAIVNKSNQWSGVLMLIAALVGFLSIRFFYTLSILLFGIAGFLAIFTKGETNEE